MMMNTKSVLIVGATSGIGKGLAGLYAEKGYRVGITGRRNELLQELKNQYPGMIETECFDVTGTENIPRIESLVKKLGGLDVLIYNSGIGEPSKQLNWQLDKLTTDTNVNGFIEICNWGFNYFIQQGHGSLVTISSVASHRGNSWAPAYSASKAFQSNYFEALTIKAYRMKKNISITCIQPGFVDTKMAKGNKIFMTMPLDKACSRIITAIEKKKRNSYLSIRWWLVAKAIRLLPFFILKKIT
jgi:short-subunit dehydrogenase